MIALHRFSSRLQPLDRTFLEDRLQGAVAYRRIAGYFRSSILELVGESLSTIPTIQVVCNSDLDPQDWQVSRRAREAALLDRWQEADPALEAALYRPQYRRLYELLRQGNLHIRVVPAQQLFLHGKAGVIEWATGHKTCFLGSVNESKRAFSTNYELLWEDPTPEGVAWVEAEFAALWEMGIPLPEVIIEQIHRIGDRQEVQLIDLAPPDLPAATLAESPLYRRGETLQPWQRDFVALFLEHRQTYDQVRLLLADEVGVGKTLSLATAALVANLLGDGPVLILCPAPLTLQWQTELLDKLAIPSAVWVSQGKYWQDAQGHIIRTRGIEDIARCPVQIAIVSTGLIIQQSPECEVLLSRRYGTIILDEAHRARRRGGIGQKASQPNHLLDFMQQIAQRSRHVLLGTATPIQTQVYELWDLLGILNQGAGFVLGTYSRWQTWETALPIVKGEQSPPTPRELWEWLQNPLPPSSEHAIFAIIRLHLGLDEKDYRVTTGFARLPPALQTHLELHLPGEPEFLYHHNPIVRHTVVRRRRTLEEKGLLERVGVIVHPQPDAPMGTYGDIAFMGVGLMANYAFECAYAAAEEFSHALGRRTRAAGFLKTILLQRLCSSFAAGRITAAKILSRQSLEEDSELASASGILSDLTPAEQQALEQVIAELERPEARDPKLTAVLAFLTQPLTDPHPWLEYGCIIFSQFYDTVTAVATALTQALPTELIAVYAGVGKSGLWQGGEFTSVDREAIKDGVKHHRIRLVIATDAACEGLNLQTLGTLINVDLPWNPSRLEQRLGRIKRFGQRRPTVEMLNLVYHDTLDEKIYEALSRRMKDRYDIFGSLPDTLEDEWIDNIEQLEDLMDKYLHLRQEARNAFELRYERHVSDDPDQWRNCARVLARQDILNVLSQPW